MGEGIGQGSGGQEEMVVDKERRKRRCNVSGHLAVLKTRWEGAGRKCDQREQRLPHRDHLSRRGQEEVSRRFGLNRLAVEGSSPSTRYKLPARDLGPEAAAQEMKALD